jgi:hypothetical protein
MLNAERLLFSLQIPLEFLHHDEVGAFGNGRQDGEYGVYFRDFHEALYGGVVYAGNDEGAQAAPKAAGREDGAEAGAVDVVHVTKIEDEVGDAFVGQNDELGLELRGYGGVQVFFLWLDEGVTFLLVDAEFHAFKFFTKVMFKPV